MTEKTIKIAKNKNKQLKLKKQQKQIEADSDISDSETLGNAPKIDKKELKQISTEVTDLLASLKKEHGIEDESAVASHKSEVKSVEKGNKNKKEAKNVAKSAAATTAAKKVAAKAAAQQPEKKALVQQQKGKANANANKNQKQAKADNAGVKNQVKVAVQSQENPIKKKKNKKRAATDNVEVKTETTDEPQPKKAKQTPAPKQNANKKQQQKQKQKQVDSKPIVKKEVTEENETEEAEDGTVGEAKVKKEHHLKNAVPVFVGNLPVNIKRLKLVKMFKKFGNILSIRIRTNTGKSFLRKAQLNKVPHLIAFLYFETREQAQASTALSGEKLGENVITVDMDSKEKATNIKPQNTVVIGNLKYAVTDNILRESFKCCGEIEHIRVVQSAFGCKGVAFIRFTKPESCALALKLNGTEILDREIRVEKYKASKVNEKKVKKEKTAKPMQKKNNANNKIANDASSPDKKKKKKNKEFLGVKSNVVKKDKVKKKKNKLSNEKRLALKVAPKAAKAISA